jgi:hypothetical protein
LQIVINIAKRNQTPGNYQNLFDQEQLQLLWPFHLLMLGQVSAQSQLA